MTQSLSTAPPFALCWFRNNGSGFDPLLRMVDSTTRALSFTLRDLNEDDSIDVLLPEFARPRIQWRRNDGSGVFMPALFIQTSVSQLERIAVGDVNADGNDDLVICSRSFSRLIVLFGTGFAGDFSSDALLAANLSTPSSGLALADFNADGYDDVVVATSGTPKYIYLVPSLQELAYNTDEVTVCSVRMRPAPCAHVCCR